MIILRSISPTFMQKEFGRKKNNGPLTLDLTNPNTFKEYQDIAKNSENKARIKQEAIQKSREKGNKIANKSSNRSYLIKKGSFRGKKLGLSPELIESTSNLKLTQSNPDWNNPGLSNAQEEILRRERQLQKRVKKGVIGSGEELTKEERWKRLSNNTKNKFKAEQANKRAALETISPKTKTERIRSLNNHYFERFKDNNSKRLHNGKSKLEVGIERLKNRGIDPLERKSATIKTSKGNIIADQASRDYFRSKEYRKSLLSNESREVLNKKSLERSRRNNLLPTTVANNEIPKQKAKVINNTPAVVNESPRQKTKVINNTPAIVNEIPRQKANLSVAKNIKSTAKNIEGNTSRFKNIAKHLKNPLVAGTLVGGGLVAGGIALSRKKKQEETAN